MTAALALAQTILAAMPFITTGTQHLFAWLAKVRVAAQQTGEWTPELEAAHQASLLARADDPASQPDPQ